MGKEKNGFVYMWKNLDNQKKYIGYHVGNLDDGYVCSSHNKSFWEDFNNDKMSWNRIILFIGNSTSCLIEEQRLLKNVNLRSDEYYNNARGSEIIFTDEVKKKMSESGKKRWNNMSFNEKCERNKKISESKLDKPRNEKTIKKMKDFYFDNDNYVGIIPKEQYNVVRKKIIESNTGKKRSNKFKEEQSKRVLGNKNPMFGKTHNNEFKKKRRDYFLSENNPGKNKTDATKLKISKSKTGVSSKFKGISRKKIRCPYCGKEGGEGIMNRWHFNNCKYKK